MFNLQNFKIMDYKIIDIEGVGDVYAEMTLRVLAMCMQRSSLPLVLTK